MTLARISHVNDSRAESINVAINRFNNGAGGILIGGDDNVSIVMSSRFSCFS